MNKKQEITTKQLRTFGIALSIFLGIIGLIQFFKGNIPGNYWYWYGALLILLVTLFIPITIRPIYQVALLIAHILGWINTRIILGFIYFFIFTPIALAMKLIGRDPLNRKFDKQATSYWYTRDRRPKLKEQYLKQF